MENKNNQLQKSHTLPSIAKQQKTLALVEKILTNSIDINLLERSLTVEGCLDKAKIREVFKTEQQNQLSYTLVKTLVTRFLNSFGFANKLTDDAIGMLAVDTLDHFEYETLEDIIIFFKMARSGKFGNTKRGVDSNLVYGEWYPMYLEHKSRIKEKLYQDQKSQSNKVNDGMDAVKKTYIEMIEQKKLKQKRDKDKMFIDNLVKNFDRQMLEDTIEDWSKFPERKDYTDMLKAKRKVIK